MAFSGGADSTACLTLLRELFPKMNLGAFYLDHGLRSEAHEERVFCEGYCRQLGVTFYQDRVDVRVLAATNKELPSEIRAGRFREDLYYRLNVIPIFVPPLRDREDDVPLLAEHFIAELAREYGRRVKTIDPGAMAGLRGYKWPGNVRELHNVIERLMIMVPVETITLKDLAFLEGLPVEAAAPYTSDGDLLALHDARDRFERDYILRALAAQQGNISRTAEILGVERSNLYRKMRAFGIASARRFDGDAEKPSEPA